MNEERMGKKKNMLKRNSGFIVGCVLAAGASFFTADILTSDQKLLQRSQSEAMTDVSETQETVPEEPNTSRTYETDAFIITASGTVIKGVDTEAPEKKTQQNQTDENGNVVTPETDENGNAVTPETNENGNVLTSETDADNSPEETTTDGSDYYDAGEDDGSWNDNGGDDGSWNDNGGDDGSWNDNGGDDGSWNDNGGDDGSWNDNGGYDDGGDNGGYDDGGDNGGYDDGGDNGGYDDGGDNGGYDDGEDNGGYETPDDVIISGISSRYIDESELYNYDAGQLRLIRNEIFALHGRIFKSQDLADYFSQKSWYVPKYDPDEFDAHMFDYLNDYEAANLQVILNYEAALAEN